MNAMLAGRGTSAWAFRRVVIGSLMTHVCTPCSSGPFGKQGHDALRYVMGGPETGRSFFRCTECGERWTRSAGMTCGFVWARSGDQRAR